MEKKKARVLTDTQMALVDAYMANGGIKIDAYKQVYDDWEIRTKPENLYSAAYNKFTKEVMAEIRSREKAMQDAQKKAAEKDAEECRKLWSRKDSVSHLVSIVSDCQRTREDAMADGDGVPVAVSRLERDTVDSLNKMMGYNEPEQQQVDQTVTVDFGDGLDDFAV